ncbi:MAG: hypothetical protein U0470_00435 [Anaerolineae bacterium]
MTANVPPLGPIVGWGDPAADGPRPPPGPDGPRSARTSSARPGPRRRHASPHPHAAAVTSGGRLEPAPRSASMPTACRASRARSSPTAAARARGDGRLERSQLHRPPPGSLSTAIYTAQVWPPGGVPTVLDTTVGLASGAARYLIRPADDVSIDRDATDGSEWPLPTGGRSA